MSTRGNQVGDGRARRPAGDQAFAHQHGVGAVPGILEDVVRSADAGLGHRDDVVGDERRESREGAAVDLQRSQVAGVDADHLGTGVKRPKDLDLVVHLDQRRHAQGLGAFAQRHQCRLVERRHDQQDDIGAVRTSFPQLIAGHHEVLAQQRSIDAGPHGVEIGQAAAELAPLGQDADDAGPTGGVVTSEPGRVGDLGEGALARARALHLGDDLDPARGGQRGVRIVDVGRPRRELAQVVQRRHSLACREVFAHPADDVVQDAHVRPPRVVGTQQC